MTDPAKQCTDALIRCLDAIKSGDINPRLMVICMEDHRDGDEMPVRYIIGGEVASASEPIGLMTRVLHNICAPKKT